MREKRWNPYFAIGFLYTLAGPIGSIWFVDGEHIGWLFATGISAMLFTRLPDIINLELSPLNGLKATLQSKIDEATATIQQLRELAAALAEPSLSTLALAGNAAIKIRRVEKYQMREQINALLAGLNLDGPTITRANAAFDHMMLRALLIHISDYQ
jgi:hypothetical protein